MMYVAHNAAAVDEKPKKAPKRERSDFAKQTAYRLYKKACEVNMERIAKIQEKYPGWMPKFNYKE